MKKLLIWLVMTLWAPALLAAEDVNLRVMSQNIWPGLNYVGNIKMGYMESDEAREERYQALVREIRRLNPDVIGINEANPLPAYARRLAEDLDYDYIQHMSDSGLRLGGLGLPVNFRAGDVLLARKGLKLEPVGRKQLSGGPQHKHWSWNFGDGTQVLVGKVSVAGRDIYVATTHPHFSAPHNGWSLKLMAQLKDRWGYTDEDYAAALGKLKADSELRRSEFSQMVAYLKEVVPAGAPLILMGDFNAEPHWEEMGIIYAAGFYDTYALVNSEPGYTWDDQLNVNVINLYRADLDRKYGSLHDHVTAYSDFVRWRIDFILANASLPDVISSEVCSNTGAVMPSDHFGVVTDFKLKR